MNPPTSRRLGNDVRPRTTGSLLNRTEEIIKLFDAADKGYAFGDSGDAEMYAAEMADLLERWAMASRASVDARPRWSGG